MRFLISLLIFSFNELSLAKNAYYLIRDHSVSNDFLESFTSMSKIKCLGKCTNRLDCSLVSITKTSCKLFNSNSWDNLTLNSSSLVYYQADMLRPKSVNTSINSTTNKTENQSPFISCSCNCESFNSTYNYKSFVENTTFLDQHSDWLYSLIFLSNGYIVSGSNDMIIWNPSNFTLSRRMVMTGYVYDLLEISSEVLAVALGGGLIELWNIRDWTLNKGIPAHLDHVSKLRCIGNGLVASGSWDFSVKIWNTSDWSLLRTLTTHTQRIWGIIMTKNGHMATGSCDNKIIIWNLTDYIVFQTLTGHSSCVYNLITLPNYDLVSGSYDKTVKIWDSLTYSLKKTLSVGQEVFTQTSLPNGKLAIGSYFLNEIQIWNYLNGTYEKSLFVISNQINSLLALPYGELMSGDRSGRITIWNKNTLN